MKSLRIRRGNAAVVAIVMVVVIALLLIAVASIAIPTHTVTTAVAVPAPITVGPPAKIVSPLLVFCAASNKAVLEKIAAAYREETGVEVQFQFGASQTLLAQIDVSRQADLYLPADDSYLATARDKGLVGEVFNLGKMQGVLAVAAGNPKKILAFDDLLSDEVRLSQANPDAAAIGKVTRDVLQKSNHWDRLAAKSALRSNVNEAANDLKLGAADAAVLWDVVAKQYPEFELVTLPELEPVTAVVAVTVATVSQQPEEALKFARYLAAEERGQKFYREAGFGPPPPAPPPIPAPAP